MPSDWQASNQLALIIHPGDIVEVYMHDMDFSHFAMYVGQGQCVHVTSDIMRKMLGPKISFWEKINLLSKFLRTREGHKELITLEHVCGIRYCRINNLEKEATKRGFNLRPLQDTISMAKEGIEMDKPLQVFYNVTSSNCEHYVTKWKYDCAQGFCTQSENGVEEPLPPNRR